MGTLIGRLIRAFRPVSEMIGRVKTTYLLTWLYRNRQGTRDLTQVDAEFWDKARHCKAKGLEISGLFLKPLASKQASWVQGRPPKWTVDNPRGQEVLAEWWTRQHSTLIRAYEEAAGLGTCFLVINADLSATLVPPNVVEMMVDDNDYSKCIGWRITEVWPHPTRPADRMTIIDEYTAVQRVHIVKKNEAEINRTVYPNLIGRIPVIPINNALGVNEIFGRPEGEALLELLHRYGELIEAAIVGNIHQGRPTPTAKFEDIEQLNRFFADYGKVQTRTLADGTTEQYYEVDFSSDDFLALAGGEFDYKQPGSFAGDTEKLLGLLFYLFLQHTEIPEFVWGNAIASSKASAESQMGPFVKWIEKKRGECRDWMLEVARVVLAYYSLFERAVKADEPRFEWERLTERDAQLTSDVVEWAYAEGLIDRETALKLLPVDIDNPADVLEKARQERAEQQANRQESDIQARLEAERQAQAARDRQQQEKAA